MNDDQWALTHFSGTARLFPLPNLVLFPHVVQPLHIFEPRYRQMTAEALASDKLIALVLLKSGWEDDYDGRPALHPVACLGRVVADQKLADGRYNLLLRGLTRVRIREELADDKPYRCARVDILTDESPTAAGEAKHLRQRLADQVLPRFAISDQARSQMMELFQGELSLGSLCDILSFALPLPLDLKQELLNECTVARRVRMLLDALTPTVSGASDRKFPPDFSEN